MTKLEKDLVRESIKLVDDKPIVVTLTKDQEICLKLKGRGSEVYTIPIESLYNTLSGRESESDFLVVDRGVERALDELYAHSMISESDYKVKVEIQKIIKEIKSWRK